MASSVKELLQIAPLSRSGQKLSHANETNLASTVGIVKRSCIISQMEWPLSFHDGCTLMYRTTRSGSWAEAAFSLDATVDHFSSTVQQLLVLGFLWLWHQTTLYCSKSPSGCSPAHLAAGDSKCRPRASDGIQTSGRRQVSPRNKSHKFNRVTLQLYLQNCTFVFVYWGDLRLSADFSQPSSKRGAFACKPTCGAI